MARGKITKRSIDVLIASSENDILWDDSIRGFGAKRTKSGAVSYVLQFRMGGRESKTRRYTIGSHGSPWSPSTARAEAERLFILVAQGTDPGEAERQRREALEAQKAQLRRLEESVGERPLPELMAELDGLEERAGRIHVPLSYADELYALRSNILMVRRRLQGEAPQT